MLKTHMRKFYIRCKKKLSISSVLSCGIKNIVTSFRSFQMTGLDVTKEEIMEAAVIVTDSDLNVVAEGPNLVLKVEDKVLDNMNDWCKQHHGDV